MEIVVQVNGDIDLSAVIGEEAQFMNPETGEYDSRDRTLADLVAEKLVDKLVSGSGMDKLQRVREIREEMVRERLAPVIEKALAGEIFPTNSLGQRIGSEVITVEDMIMREAVKMLTGGGNRYDRNPTVLETVISKQVGLALTKELNEAVGEAKAKVVAAVRARAAEYLTDTALARETGL